MNIIQARGVKKRYKTGVMAVTGVDLDIEKGEFVFVIGSTGCGKSTLIKMLYREEKPTDGKIMIAGIDVARLRNNKVYKLRRKLGVVFQDYKLLPKLTVYENVAFALEVTGAETKEVRKKVIRVLELVGLKHKAKEYPSKLSGGEQQRVAIARAIVNNPTLLICDEPTGNLDAKISKEIMDVLEQINTNLGTTILMVTHDNDIVNRMKKRVLVLKEGRLEKDYKEGEYKNASL